MIFYSTYIYGANFIVKFRWKSGFLRFGPLEPPPLGHQRVKVPWSRKCKALMHLSVKALSRIVLLALITL